MQEDSPSVVELVTAFRSGELDLPALLAALDKCQSLPEEEYRIGFETLWRMREERAIDEVTISTLLERMQSMRTQLGTAPAGDDVTVIKPAPRAGDQTDDVTRVLPANDVAAAPPDINSTGSHSHSAATAGWEHVVAASDRYVSVGSTLKGRFLLERELGRGGMGVVYLAQDARKIEARDRDPWVAVKVLSDEFRRHPDSLVALQREARRSQQLAHDNIVRVHDFDKDEGIVFMTMEYVAGSDLRTYIREQASNGMSLARARPLIEGMARALGRAHAAGIVHSDFKPGNVMVTLDGTPKVFDFGIARAGQHKADASGEQTVFDVATLGALTPAYASLEMLRGQAPTPADDIYALGCVCVELLTGRHPFDKSSAEVALKEGRRLPPIPGLSRRQYQTLSAAVAFEQSKRLPDVQSLLEGLRDVGWRERVLPVVGYGTAATVVLVAAGVGLWRHEASSRLNKVVEGFSATAPDRYRDEAQAVAGLESLDDEQRAQFLVGSGDLVRQFLVRRLDELWKPEAGRFDFPGIAKVFALRDRLRLYAPAMDARRAVIESERDSQLNALDTRLGEQLLGSGNLFANGAGSLQETLGRIGMIDPGSPLLHTPDLEVGYAQAISTALAEGQQELARSQLALATKQFPQSLRLQLQQAKLRSLARPAADAAAAGSVAQATASFEQLLQAPSAAADWQAKMAAVMARLRDDPAQLQNAQLRLGETVAATLASHDQPAQLPDDLILLDFALEYAAKTPSLQQQHAHLQQRQLAAMANLEAERAQAEVVARGESLRRAVAAGDIDKAESLFARLRTLRPDAAFVREQAPALLAQAYQSQADAQFAKGDYPAAVKTVARGIATLVSNTSLPKLQARYQLVAAVMAVNDATPAGEREQLRQRLDSQFRADGTAMARLEREMQARGQLPQGSLRGRLQLGGAEPSPDQVATKAGSTPRPALASASTKRGASAAALASAASEDEPLPPVPDGPDPCDGLAGRARPCYDPVGEGRGPMMMVVPGMAGGKPFALARGEIAVDDLNIYCRATGQCAVRTVASAELGRLPAQNVTLGQAKGYARWLTRASGGWRYRLPTDAEWLHAAQASQRWRQAPDSNCIPPTATAEQAGAPAGVRGREANPWGLVNLAGNVWEWVSGGDGAALRGGSYASFWSDCTVEARRAAPTAAQADVGFRVLRELK